MQDKWGIDETDATANKLKHNDCAGFWKEVHTHTHNCKKSSSVKQYRWLLWTMVEAYVFQQAARVCTSRYVVVERYAYWQSRGHWFQSSLLPFRGLGNFILSTTAQFTQLYNRVPGYRTCCNHGPVVSTTVLFFLFYYCSGQQPFSTVWFGG